MIETPEQILAEVFSLPPASVGSIDLNVSTDSMVLINDEGPINTSTVTNRRLSFVAVSANRDDFDQLSQLAYLQRVAGTFKVDAFSLDMATDRLYRPYWRAKVELTLLRGPETAKLIQAYASI